MKYLCFFLSCRKFYLVCDIIICDPDNDLTLSNSQVCVVGIGSEIYITRGVWLINGYRSLDY